jgi:hypothetical protein
MRSIGYSRESGWKDGFNADGAVGRHISHELVGIFICSSMIQSLGTKYSL